MISRLKKYMEYKRLIPSQFADNAGIPRSTFSQLTKSSDKSDEKTISSDIVSKIHQAYPDLSIVWLLWGEGEMLTTSTREEKQEQLNHQPELDFFNMDVEPEIILPSISVEPKTKTNTVIPSAVDNTAPVDVQNDNMKIEAPQGKTSPRITKIIVFYDDNTFESFVNDKIGTKSQK